MKYHRLTALALAALMFVTPLAAACSPDRDAGEIVSPMPDTPDLPEMPQVPETPADGDPGEDAQEPTPPEMPQPPETEEPEEEEPEEEEPAEEPVISVQAQYVLSHANGLNVRAGMGTGYASLGQINKGDMVHFVRREGGWYETRYRGRAAYVSADAAYTSVSFLDKADDRIERVIAQGLELLGVPYVYGATRLHDGKGNFLKGFSANAFDCSSLMQYIFYTGAGILLDVTTRTQVKQGIPVTWQDIERGDLLFYTNAQRYNKTGVERIGHVALYLGNNYILHTASDYAVIEQMSATRQRYFVTARRFF